MTQKVPFVGSPRKDDWLSTCTSLLVLITAPAMLESVHWTLALAAHFRPYLLVAWVICGLAHAVRARMSGIIVALMTSVFLLLGLQQDPPPASSNTANLKIMQVNVQMNAEDTAPLVEHIRETNPDIVSLVEVDQRWVDELTAQLEYPHVEVQPRSDFLGLALLSRHPIRSYEVGDLSPGIPASTAVIKVDKRPITLSTVHVLPPVTADWARSQREALETLAKERSKHGPRWVVCGDFNATPWSRAFRTFASQAGLSPVSTGNWFSGTWPASIPFTGLAIDHCLLASGLQAGVAEVGPALSGDHRPISVSIDSSVR